MLERRKCPVCEELDWVRYVFVDSYEEETKSCSRDNPIDMDFVYICPSLHIYNEQGEPVKRD